MKVARLAVCICILALAPLACSDDDAPGNGGGSTGDGGTLPSLLLPDLPQPAASVEGGSADGASGAGTAGGTVSLTSRGDLLLDQSVVPAATPAAPTGGTALPAGVFAADVSSPGSVLIQGSIITEGSDAVRTISVSGGDIVVEGVLRGANLGGATQGLALIAPGGTVHVSGTIDTRGGDDGGASGQAGGDVIITARDVVITGALLSHGGVGTIAGGRGGAITITATASVTITGPIDGFGGDAQGDEATTGGAAAAMRIQAGGDVQLLGPARLHGGGASSRRAAATAGAGAPVYLDADGAVMLVGSLDARGGPAVAGGGLATPGTAGSILVGQTAPPARVAVGLPFILRGGAGPDAGGAGGAFTALARAGDIRLASLIDVGGGASPVAAGNGGTIQGGTGPDGGNVSLAGRLLGKGGDAQPGGNGNGGLGGVLRWANTFIRGDFTVQDTGEISFDGGSATGSGRAGGGGDMKISTVDGNFSLFGKIQALGGKAPDAGGIGGEGGILYVFTDFNADGIGGNLIIEPSGTIDVSGGDGTVGGSARNNGGQGVALFPINQEQLSVLLNSENIQGNSTDGICDNRGLITSRGGKPDGWGGDVMYHGRQPSGEDKTIPGRIANEGGGAGVPSGDFAGE